MFAPYCPSCQTRVLLGPRRIVAAHLDGRPARVDLRCFCGAVVPSDNPVPSAPTMLAAARHDPIDRVA